MGSTVRRRMTLAWLAAGLVLLLGALQLTAAIEIRPLQFEIRPPPEPIPQKQFEIRPPPEPIPQKLEVRETPTEVRIELPGDVLFDFDKWDIRPDAEPTLRQVAEIIQRYPRAKVAIAGYTDAKGAETYNQQLSKQRAASVKAWLVRQGGIDGKWMTTKGWGEAKPVAPNTHPDGSDNPEGRQKNRRVELTVKK
jgi:outer membrane protein OmpA-like peptidoglycan-associated protein